MKIALIGPGLMPIPPIGWGAIEILIWKYYQALTKIGHEVTIFNTTNLKEVVERVNTNEFDFVHVQYDEFINFFLQHCTVPFSITSHYGYILKQEKWSKGYFSIFTDFLCAPHIIALSPTIGQLYLSAGYKGNLSILKNGIDIEQFSFKPTGNGKVLCLGKIEPRKRQAILARMVDCSVEVDFVGPLADKDFKTGKTTVYTGVWSKEEVVKKLTDYSALVLFSDGEAAPLVVVEALAAGLSIVISQSASANLEVKPYITILKDDEQDREIVIKALHDAVKNNFLYRNDIREYARNSFDNSVILKEYELIIADSVKNKSTSFHSNGYKRKHFVHYFLSRAWFTLSKVLILRKTRDLLRKL